MMRDAQRSKKMILHIFNPEHDLALASNLDNFTAPHAARELRAGLGFLPAFWAADGDAVLVDDAGYAAKAFGKAATRLGLPSAARINFVTKEQLDGLCPDKVEAWGWDTTLRNYLLRNGIDAAVLPTLDRLDSIRTISHRQTAATVLASLTAIEGTVGEAHTACDMDTIEALLARHGRIVVKAPWSSSGRGVRFIDAEISPQLEGWIKNMLNKQGCLMVEAYYNKVKDFGMEFTSDGQGGVAYEGLSLFHTVNGAYAGNILATEQAKQKMLERYADEFLLHRVREALIGSLSGICKGRYAGPLGVDMMIVARADGDGFLLHPCVEINLRRTMGHVALSLSPTDDDIKRVMRITTGTNYLLKIQPL